jgi:hypothetical protein
MHKKELTKAMANIVQLDFTAEQLGKIIPTVTCILIL